MKNIIGTPMLGYGVEIQLVMADYVTIEMKTIQHFKKTFYFEYFDKSVVNTGFIVLNGTVFYESDLIKMLYFFP